MSPPAAFDPLNCMMCRQVTCIVIEINYIDYPEEM